MKINKLLTITLVCSLFAATPVMAAPVHGNNGKSQVIQYADLDHTLTAAAEKAIEQYANGKVFKLEEASKSEYYVDKNKKESWIIQAKDRSAIISVDAISAKVLTVSLSFNIDEITGDYPAYLKAAQSAGKQLNGKSELAFSEAHFFQDNEEGQKRASVTFNAEDEQFITIDVNTGKSVNYRLKYKEADVDRKIVTEAEKAVKSMGISKVQPFTNIERQKINGVVGEEVWELKRRVEVNGDRSKYKALEMVDNRAFFVEAYATVEVKTGKLISISVPPKKDNQKPKSLTKEQGIALAKPAAKKLFGVDLSSYTLKVDKDWGDYTFSSKGKESIVAKFDNYGNLVRMERNFKKQ
ncbi:hypothetical protein [Paenibacillus sp. ISL-20]|uniref:hypothetical protein n=1 Tax=Paenibacillus sp. ISL-20 TaxID=2819163 RepID=UPI001BEB57DE|nr:hypothetical protein [Paenibacillus sp. ISL-20]MBT2765831.1 hypothetical protein [Paenibacillus sp. ISL-20]